MPTQAPPSDDGPPGSFIGKTITQYDTTGGLMVTMIQREDSKRTSSGQWSVKQPEGRRLVLEGAE